jgi:steroid delta-isomerase-like uncharacterized protein
MKSILYFLIATFFVASCNTGNEANEPASGNEKIVNQYFEHFNRHEWDKIAGLYADSVDIKDPALGVAMVKQSRQQVVARYKQLNGFLPDLSARVANMYNSGNNIIVEFISSGSSPDGMKIELPICTIFSIDNGRITRDYSYYDNAGGSSK